MGSPARVAPSAESLSTHAALAVSRGRFVVIWWLAHGLHAALIAYSVYVIKLHRYFITQGLQATIAYMGPTVISFFDAVIVAQYVLIVCHTAAMLRSVGLSVYRREWLFVDRHSSHQRHLSHPAVTQQPLPSKRALTARGVTRPLDSTAQPLEVAVAQTRFQRCVQVLEKVRLALFGRYGFFSVEGTYYESIFFLIEIVEIALQSFQAYKLSHLVPRIWINRLNTIVLILNCCSTTIVHQYLRTDRLTKRVVLLVVDGIFDIISSMVIPLVIIHPYYSEFDSSIGDFPLVNYYHDKWFIRAVSENRQVFVTSWIDYISKITPGITVFGGMLVLKQYVMINRRITSDRAVALHNYHEGTSYADPLPVVPSSPVRIGPTFHADAQIRGPAIPVNQSIQLTRAQRLRKSWQHLLPFLAGLAILIIHIHSTTVAVMSHTRGCLLEVRPWFATSYTCIALEINCANGEYGDGVNVAALEDPRKAVVPSALRSLIFASCARLHVPPMIQSFSGLQMIKIYNSTIVTWDGTAELRGDLHPDLQLLYISDSNFTGDGELPKGLQSANFPPALTDIEFSGTNIKHFPSNLHEKWTNMQYFVLERSAMITQIPEQLVKMKIPRLFLASNAIAAISEYLLTDQAFWTLNLNGNPLQALPDTIGDLRSLYRVEIGHTNVSALPSWLTGVQNDAATGKQVVSFLGYATVVAGGTPLCEDAAKLEIAARAKLPWVRLDCAGRETDYVYPIDKEREWRAASLAQMR